MEIVKVCLPVSLNCHRGDQQSINEYTRYYVKAHGSDPTLPPVAAKALFLYIHGIGLTAFEVIEFHGSLDLWWQRNIVETDAVFHHHANQYTTLLSPTRDKEWLSTFISFPSRACNEVSCYTRLRTLFFGLSQLLVFPAIARNGPLVHFTLWVGLQPLVMEVDECGRVFQGRIPANARSMVNCRYGNVKSFATCHRNRSLIALCTESPRVKSAPSANDQRQIL